MNACIKVVKKINEALLMVCVIFLLCSTVLATLNALLRKFSDNGGFPWAEELSTYFVVMMIFLGLACLELKDNNLCIGVVDSLLKSERSRNIIRILRGLVTIFLMIIMVKYGIVVLTNMYKSQMITYALHVPKLYFFISLMVAFVMTIIVWLTIIICKRGGKIEC